MSDEKLLLAGEILDILHDVWPQSSHATVHLESHQWVRLLRVLLDAVGHLAEDEDTAPAPVADPDDTVVFPALREGRPQVPPRGVPPWHWAPDEVFREDIEKTISGLHGKSPRVRGADDGD